MKTHMIKKMTTAALALGLAAGMTHGLRADTFGSGGNQFTMDFVTIGNPGNGNDTNGYGGVSYEYRMGTYEISQSMINKASASGVDGMPGGYWTGDQPSVNITWYQAAAFVNWLNTSTGHQAAYNLSYSGSWSMSLWSSGDAWQLDGENLYRNKDAYYFLASEDEWYKAAYHKNDGVTANYWLYPTVSDTVPTAVASGTNAGTAVYYNLTNKPADVTAAGGLSAYGTMGQGGNVYEWNESAYDGTNDSSSESRAFRGGYWSDDGYYLSSSYRFFYSTLGSQYYLGFRVASVPEPSTGVLVLLAGGALLLGRRWKRSL